MKKENKHSGNVYALGIIKYDKQIYRDHNSQFLIMSDQLDIIKEKIGQEPIISELK